MKRKTSAVLRRAKRLSHLVSIGKTTQALRSRMVGLMVNAALSPLVAMAPAANKPAKVKSRTPKAGLSLRVVLGQLAAARASRPATQRSLTKHTPAPRLLAGAEFRNRRHRGAAGSRTYKLFLPAPLSEKPKGLVVMLHGCNQTPDDFANGTHMNALAQRHGLAVAYPAQTRAHNAASCWNWFQPAHQSRNAGEPAILAALTRKLMKEFDLGRAQVFVAGLSAGGALAAILLDEYPDVFSAAGIHSGLARGAANNALSAMMIMQNGGTVTNTEPKPDAAKSVVRWILFQGADDTTVHPANALNILAGIVGPNAVPERSVGRSVNGRRYVRSEYTGPRGATLVENWLVQGAGHAWSGGRASGSYVDPKGPDASAQMIRFFLTKSA